MSATAKVDGKNKVFKNGEWLNDKKLQQITISVSGCRECIEKFSKNRKCDFNPEYIDHKFFNKNCKNKADEINKDIKKLIFNIGKSHSMLSKEEYNRNPVYNDSHYSFIAEVEFLKQLKNIGLYDEFLSFLEK